MKVKADEMEANVKTTKKLTKCNSYRKWTLVTALPAKSTRFYASFLTTDDNSKLLLKDLSCSDVVSIFFNKENM